MTPRTILVPVDFSDCADDLVLEASRLAAAGGNRLVLLHVSDTPAGLPLGSTIAPKGAPAQSAEQYLRHAAEKRLHEYVEMARQNSASARSLVMTGEAAPTILEVADELRADAIVMGTHGRSGVARALLGSVAEAVMQHARCPVTTVRTQRKATCEAKSCAWCATHVTGELTTLSAEADG